MNPALEGCRVFCNFAQKVMSCCSGNQFHYRVGTLSLTVCFLHGEREGGGGEGAKQQTNYYSVSTWRRNSEEPRKGCRWLHLKKKLKKTERLPTRILGCVPYQGTYVPTYPSTQSRKHRCCQAGGIITTKAWCYNLLCIWGAPGGLRWGGGGGFEILKLLHAST